MKSAGPLSQIAIELKSSELCSRGFTVLDYSGMSMFPHFLEGDQVTIASYKNTNPQIGDVIVFLQGDKLVIHRLIRIHKNGSEGTHRFISKGDNSRSADPSIKREKILGKAISIQRGSHQIKLDSFKEIVIQRVLAHLSFLNLRLRDYFNFFRAKVRGR